MKIKNKKKFIILSSLSVTTAAIALSATFLQKGTNQSPISADDCPHNVVEHYQGLNAVSGHVEHWACCECHTAWADEGRTIPLGNTAKDRSKIDFSTLCTYQAMETTDWSTKPAEPVYDETDGFAFRAHLVDLGASKQNEIATINSDFTLEEKGYDYFGGVITNKTSSNLNMTLFDRAWNKSIMDFSLAVGESRTFLVSAADWANSKSGTNYGFAFLATNTSNVEEGGYVELSKPKFFTDYSNLLSTIQSSGDVWKDFEYAFDVEHGLTLDSSVEASTVFFIMGRELLDASKYLGVRFKVYNGTSQNTSSGNIWNEDWVHSCPRPAFIANSWTEVTIPTEVWNGDNSTIGLYDMSNAAGLYKFGDFELIEKGAPYVCFGEADNEQITYEPAWAPATKTTDPEKGNIFSFEYPDGATCFATNNGKTTIDTSVYSTVEFYVYNGTDSEFTMYSTPDWSHNANYGTIAKDAWTLCSMPASDFNIAPTIYFYPSGNPIGTIKVTYFVAK